MTEYSFPPNHKSYSERASEAKTKRQAVLQRVRAQRAQAYKKTVSEWMKDGAIIRGSDLKRRYMAA